MRRITVAWGWVLSAVSAAGLEAQWPASPATAALDSLITHQMAEAGIMGLGAAVIVDRRVVGMRGYGPRRASWGSVRR